MKKKKSTKELNDYLLKNNPTKEGDYEKIGKIFNCTGDAVRKRCERLKLPNVRNNVQSKRNENSFAERVKQSIKNRQRTLLELCELLDATPKEIREALAELKSNKFVIDSIGENLKLAETIQPTESPFAIDFKKHKEVEYPIGFVTDNHIGSKYERLDVLHSLYERFKSEGVETVYNGGNMIDGEARFNKYDIYVHGINSQVKNLIDKYPKIEGIKTHFVCGDDHEGWYVQREHIDIGSLIEDMANRNGRNDLINLGYMERDIEYKQKGGSSIIRVIHAGGGSSYAHSYTSQKYVESLQGGEKPTIVLVGHYHKFNYGYPREVHVIQGGCTQDQTPFMRKNRIQAMVGGVILWVKQNDLGIFTSVKVEWLPYYDKKYYAYNW